MEGGKKKKQKGKNTDCVQAGRVVNPATSAQKTQEINTFKYTTFVEQYRTIHDFYCRGSNHLPYIPETITVAKTASWKYCSTGSQVYPPYSKYIMLITWFWEEPIRHDLHLKTALIMSSHRECVFLTW